VGEKEVTPEQEAELVRRMSDELLQGSTPPPVSAGSGCPSQPLEVRDRSETEDPVAMFFGAIPQAVIVFSACIFAASLAVIALRIAVFAVTGH
jgi:hypothetical protein